MRRASPGVSSGAGVGGVLLISDVRLAEAPTGEAGEVPHRGNGVVGNACAHHRAVDADDACPTGSATAVETAGFGAGAVERAG